MGEPLKGNFDYPASDALLEFMRTGWAQRRPRLTREPDGDAERAETRGRRQQLSSAFPGELLVIATGVAPTRSNDSSYRFRPDTNFRYLVTEDAQGSVLVFYPTADGHDAVLYRRNGIQRGTEQNVFRHAEFWTGLWLTREEAEQATGVECRDLERLESDLESAAVGRLAGPVADTLLAHDISKDDELLTTLTELRLVKSEWEIGQLQRAVDITARGFSDVVRAIASDPHPDERLVEGTFDLRARREANGVGYLSIAGAGRNATILHWEDNDGRIHDGDLLLLDAGAEVESLHTADVTRTFPVSGRYTDAQRTIYDLVFAAQQAAVAEVRAGNRVRAYHDAAMSVLAHGLADLGMLPVSADEALHADGGHFRRWSLHLCGHMLGMDVHDCTKARVSEYAEATLVPGHVLTVEPGLYFQPDDLLVPPELRGIGVRIEDDVVVTDADPLVLSAGLPRTPEEVEAWVTTA